MSLSEDCHLVEEVRVNLQWLRHGVAKANMKWAATDCGLPYGPLAELPGVPQALPEERRQEKEAEMSKMGGPTGDPPGSRLGFYCLPCSMLGGTPPESEPSSVRA